MTCNRQGNSNDRLSPNCIRAIAALQNPLFRDRPSGPVDQMALVDEALAIINDSPAVARNRHRRHDTSGSQDNSLDRQ